MAGAIKPPRDGKNHRYVFLDGIFSLFTNAVFNTSDGFFFQTFH